MTGMLHLQTIMASLYFMSDPVAFCASPYKAYGSSLGAITLTREGTTHGAQAQVLTWTSRVSALSRWQRHSTQRSA